MQEAPQPRIIRIGTAPGYCAMNERIFNQEIRPYITEIPIGERGIGIDRLELDQVLDDYISRYGRAPSRSLEQNQCKKVSKVSQDLRSGTVTGGSASRSTVSDFAKVAEQITSKKQKRT